MGEYITTPNKVLAIKCIIYLPFQVSPCDSVALISTVLECVPALVADVSRSLLVLLVLEYLLDGENLSYPCERDPA